MSRAPNTLDVFTTGADGKTYTAAWDQARAGQWRGFWNVLGGAIPAGGAVTAISGRPDQLDVFLVSTDGGVYTAAWDRDVADQQGRGWWKVGV